MAQWTTWWVTLGSEGPPAHPVSLTLCPAGPSACGRPSWGLLPCKNQSSRVCNIPVAFSSSQHFYNLR